jgi:hypothetical protein
VNWEAVSAIGELVGAIGVVVTLACVGVQVRQNTKAVRSATLSAITASHPAELRWSSDLGVAMMEALHRPRELTALETHQVTEWMTSSFLARESEFSQCRQGLLEREKWQQSVVIVQVIAGFPWFLQ